MTTPVKWALAAGVLALALLVAFLPRDNGGPPAEDLGPARAAAALQPCPDVGGGQVAQLAGVSARCLADGRTVDLGAALAGEPTLVNVWATWCEPCREELPVLAEYARRPDAVRVLTVQVASDERAGLELLTELGVHLPGVYDGEGTDGPVSRALKLPRVLPASYLVTADGTVEFIDAPRLLTSVDQVREAVERGSAVP
ncbi:thiol-disulfide isomerase/thioredoxin [Prauserella shujinwangii]|uniref:Thiol-disulfide isomerase/thioredoxin n=1 Tax=Prauserella shujinwangii TaxID=1453103 RepID=A0A2T0LNK9_9PSEU|nr:TlpA disulfide reductase family protein [Prauserella shujinwangii]PRX44775.1 thiol-disulfide isomerase/thioredoxin [Prauserella shujinwangii]